MSGLNALLEAAQRLSENNPFGLTKGSPSPRGSQIMEEHCYGKTATKDPPDRSVIISSLDGGESEQTASGSTPPMEMSINSPSNLQAGPATLIPWQNRSAPAGQLETSLDKSSHANAWMNRSTPINPFIFPDTSSSVESPTSLSASCGHKMTSSDDPGLKTGSMMQRVFNLSVPKEPACKVKPGAHDIYHVTKQNRTKTSATQSFIEQRNITFFPINHLNPRLNRSVPIKRSSVKLPSNSNSTINKSRSGWRTSSAHSNPWRNRSLPLGEQEAMMVDQHSSYPFNIEHENMLARFRETTQDADRERIMCDITNKPLPMAVSQCSSNEQQGTKRDYQVEMVVDASFINIVTSTPSHTINKTKTALVPNKLLHDEHHEAFASVIPSCNPYFISNTSEDMVEDASFINIVTSTPSSTPLPEPRPEYQQTTFSALANESATTNKEYLSKKRLFDCEDSKRLFKENDLEERRLYDSSSDCDDSDWNLDNVSDTTDGSDQEGDASDLADLSIYEYFQKYHTLDDLGSENYLENANNESSEAFPTKQVIVEGETATLPEHTGNTPRINISIQVVDDMAKECLEPIISKAEMRAMNKRRKERGLEYTRPDGVIVRARELRPPCNCKRKCSEKYPDSIRSKLLEQLLSLKLSGQNQFLANHMVVSKTARSKVINSRRLFSRSYKLPGVKGSVTVCKVMFMATFDVGDRKLRNLAAKKVIGDGVASDDQRCGNRSTRTISPEHIKYIKDHILSFPAYTSHYGRAKSDRLYISGDLNLTAMYKLYQAKCGTDNLIAVCYDSYRTIFKSFNLHFRKPKLDTCDQCDRLKIEIRMASQEEVTRLKQAQEEHHDAARRVYHQKKKDMDRSKIDYTIRAVSFDLQKQLPTPYLKCGVAFYKRQLYTLNLTVFESYLGQNKAFCYMWDETRAKRGSKEVGSCIMKDLLQMPNTVEEVIYYSDRCAGQNHNKNIVFMFTHVLKTFKNNGRTLRVIHRFMKSGHSHMEVDTVHAAIERAKKRTDVAIDIPPDWEIFIAAIQRTVPFQVVSMQQKDFRNIGSLEEVYSIPKTTTSGEAFSFKNVMEFAFSTEDTGKVRFKYDVGDENYREISLISGKKPDRDIELKPIETQLIPLSSEKLKDLQSLLPYVVKKSYYEAFLKGLVEPKRGRKPQNNNVPDHFESDIYDVSDDED